MPGGQGKDGIGESLDEGEVVEHAENRASIPAGFLFEHGQNPLCQRGVKMRNRFVGKDQFRFLHQCASHGDTLLFPAGESSNQAMAEGPEAECFEAAIRMSVFRGGKADQCSPPGMARQCAGEDVLQRRRVAGQMKLLENQADTTAEIAGCMQTLTLTPIGDGAGLMRPDSGESFQECRFAGARRADDSNELTPWNSEVQIANQDPPPTLKRQVLNLQVRRVVRRGRLGWAMGIQGMRGLATLLGQRECLGQGAEMLSFIDFNEPGDKRVLPQVVMFRLIQSEEGALKPATIGIGKAAPGGEDMRGDGALLVDLSELSALFRAEVFVFVKDVVTDGGGFGFPTENPFHSGDVPAAEPDMAGAKELLGGSAFGDQPLGIQVMKRDHITRRAGSTGKGDGQTAEVVNRTV
jgi:hypothetical protein